MPLPRPGCDVPTRIVSNVSHRQHSKIQPDRIRQRHLVFGRVAFPAEGVHDCFIIDPRQLGSPDAWNDHFAADVVEKPPDKAKLIEQTKENLKKIILVYRIHERKRNKQYYSMAVSYTHLTLPTTPYV